VAVAAQRAGPSYALPGQAASTVSRGTQKQDWVRIKSAYQPKVGQNSTGVDTYRRHRFPPPIIQHAIWLYLRFTLSYRDVE
jgi:hypothetical protein